LVANLMGGTRSDFATSMKARRAGITIPTIAAVIVAVAVVASAGYFYAFSGTSGTRQPGQTTSSAQVEEWKAFSARTFHVGCCPGYVAFDEKNGLVYASVQPANAVYAVDPVTGAIVANISVGSYPRDLVVDPINGLVYVVNQGSDSVSVIDGSKNKVVATIQVGRNPVEIAVDSKTGLLYVPAELSHELSVIDGADDMVVAEVAIGCNGPCGNASTGVPNSVEVNPSTDMVYVTANGVDALYAVNGSTNLVVGSVSVGTHPDGVTVDPGSDTVYVSNLLNNTVSVVNAAKMEVVSTVKVGSSPADLAFSSVLGDVFVVNQGNDSVSVIGAGTNSLIGNVRAGPDYCLSCGTGPVGGLGVDAVNGDVYVAVPGTGNITEISKCDTSTCPLVSGATPPCVSYGVMWTYPNSSPIPPGSRITSSISTCSAGAGSWRISIQSQNQTVAEGTFSCPCADRVLFNYTSGDPPLTAGKYWFQSSFNGGGFGAEFDVPSA
jgi:YVTN family beta-propeller protein